MAGKTVFNRWLVFLLMPLLSNTVFVPKTPKVPAKTELLCPENCRCLEEELTASCYLSFSEFSLEALSLWRVKSLDLYRDKTLREEGTIFPSLQSLIFEDKVQGVTNAENSILGLSYLAHLHISDIAILQLRDFAFISMPHLKVLELTNDNITTVHEQTFAGLSVLQNLGLKENEISVLPKHVFRDLVSLVKLDLSGNNLKTIHADTFDSLSRLQILDLSNNALRHIERFANNLTSLNHLDVTYNYIMYILNDTVSDLLSVETIDIVGNPFECSCAISMLISSAQQNMSFMDPEAVTCAGPSEMTGQSFKDVRTENLPCESAKVSSISDSSVTPYQFSAVLNCTAVGSAPIGIYWLTPWGDNFSHPSMHESLPKYISDVKYDSQYQGVTFPLTSRVYVSENGSLHIDRFRGYFSGNFTCVAVNLIGFDELSVEIQISTYFKSIYYKSLFVSGICASAMFIIAVMIGSIRWCVSKCFHGDDCQCCCCSADEFPSTKDIYKIESEEIEVINGELYYKSNNDDKDFYEDEDSPPKTPLNSPAYQTPQYTPKKCSTPNNEAIEPEGWISVRIMDQLDEVRSRLRDGAERRMRKVKSLGKSIHESGSNKIKNIKETGSLKIQSIKETSSQAASAVMKSVESGMEQVKYGYQSIKEFCGTSDLGPGTISMMSVTTDVDTEEQVRVVKSHTFV